MFPREVGLIYTGILPSLYVANECRCPPAYPRVNVQQPNLCISNIGNGGSGVYRINNNSHPLEYIADLNFNSFWISSFIDSLYIEIDLGDQFEVRSLKSLI